MFVLPLALSAHRHAYRNAALPRAMARLLDERCASADASANEARQPAMSVVENDPAYTLRFDIPGVSKEQLKVSVEGRRVSVETLAATDAPATDVAAPRVLYTERAAPRYARTVVLPTEVDQATAQARVEHGVLTLTLNKRVPGGATQISIN